VFCPRGHSFDVAQRGYINLLQPQDRRSKHPGDTIAAMAGRRRLHDQGTTGPLLRAIADMVAASPEDSVLDAGCGDGFYLGAMASQSGFAGTASISRFGPWTPQPAVTPSVNGLWPTRTDLCHMRTARFRLFNRSRHA